MNEGKEHIYSSNFAAYDFFAGSGLVTRSLQPLFNIVWANDISCQKAKVYTSNHGNDHFLLEDINQVKGSHLPCANLSWASFPCQDLSLAGNTEGINGLRSGLVWEWLRIMDELPVKPNVLVAENVEGLVSSSNGSNYETLHKYLVNHGYNVGAIIINSEMWVPQSRPRVFIIAVNSKVELPEQLIDTKPNWLHNDSIVRIANRLDNWIWWHMPKPQKRTQTVKDIVDWSAQFDNKEKTMRLLELLSAKHRLILDNSDNIVATGYKRTRNGKQTLELRFDGIAGCLRTPKGGSSRQILLVKSGNQIATRLFTPREAARLMGAPEDYILPENYNEAYMAMGDAVVVPVVKHLAVNILYPITIASNIQTRMAVNNESVAI